MAQLLSLIRENASLSNPKMGEKISDSKFVSPLKLLREKVGPFDSDCKRCAHFLHKIHPYATRTAEMAESSEQFK